MKLFFAILKIFAVLIITVTVILFTASILMQDKVAAIILKSLNKNISTKFDFESVRLSFLKKFPNASLDLKNVLVYSSPGYDKTCFSGINTDTLLSARSVQVEFRITDIIKGIYKIDRIGVREGNLNLYTDTAGLVNYEIKVADNEKTNDVFNINLDRINISGLKATYNNLATKLIITGWVKNGRLKSYISGDEIDFIATAGIRIDLFRLYNFSFSKSIDAELDINLHDSGKGTLFNKSSIILDDYYFELAGFISSDNVLNLSLTGEKIDISGVKNYFSGKYMDKISAYNPSGVLNIDGKIKGLFTRTTNPGIEISFSLDKGGVTYGNSAFNILDLSFIGSFTNGSGRVPATSSLSFTDLKGTLGSATYSGSLILADFDSLTGMLELKGKIIPAELKEFFNIKEISSTEGTIDLDLKTEGRIPRKEKYSLLDLFSLNTTANLTFNSFGMGLKKDKIIVNNVNGYLSVSDTVKPKDLQLTFKNQEFLINGFFIHLPEWLAGEPVVLKGTADISCNKLLPDSFFHKLSTVDSSSENKKGFSLPGDIILDLNFKIDNLIFNSFQAEKVTGHLSYKPRILNFIRLKLNSLDGIISGNGFIVQSTYNKFIGRGIFNLEKINVNKAFTVFHNFGQDFLKSENIAGTLSGSLSLLLPMDSLLIPDIKSITAEGKYVLEDGALINFEPVKELSSFIELSELEDIRFEQMKNDFFIKNNFFYLPQMEVKSTAADLSVNGKHSFDNNYEYHVKILLSEILSKKIRKPKPNTTEFGAVKDDGLGRTSLVLKIENKGEDINVGYDIKAAGNLIKNDIKSERQTLKTILNQEYGWFKNDSAVRQTQTTGAPRFKITWDETDTIKVETDLPVEKKENGMKNLFRKRLN
jgi:hypothetical protein